MMKIFFLLSLFLIVASAAHSQSAKTTSITDSTNNVIASKDYIIMKEGIIMLVKNGTAFSFNGPMILQNGIPVDANGSYRLNGHQMPLKDGDSLYLNGRVVLNNRSQPVPNAERVY